MEIENEKIVSWVEAKKIMEKRSKESELGYEQKNALDHLRKFCKLTEKKAEEMFESLKQIEKLNERQKMNIINMMPKDSDELRLLFANEIITLSEDDRKKILSIVKKFST